MSQYYKKYMKKREEEKPGYLKLFFGAFLVMVIFFIILATHFSSSVDTTIGENDEGDTKESGIGVKHLIDSRLRFIQMEDSSPSRMKDNDETVSTLEKTMKDGSEYSSKYENVYGGDVQESVPKPCQSEVVKNNTETADYASKTYTAPTPATQLRTNSVSPAHNIQKNLTPTGLN